MSSVDNFLNSAMCSKKYLRMHKNLEPGKIYFLYICSAGEHILEGYIPINDYIATKGNWKEIVDITVDTTKEFREKCPDCDYEKTKLCYYR